MIIIKITFIALIVQQSLTIKYRGANSLRCFFFGYLYNDTSVTIALKSFMLKARSNKKAHH